MKKELEARFDLRIDASLKEQFREFCDKKGIKLSKGGREALLAYVRQKTLISSIIENNQNPIFFKKFNTAYDTLPNPVKELLNDILGTEEENIVNLTPPQLLKNTRVITLRGRKALNKKL